MSLKIRISVLNKRRRTNVRELKKYALRVLRAFGKTEALVDITFVDNRRIKALNKKYMGRNRSTDVLSFFLGDEPAARKNCLIGDIYISSDMAAKNTGFYGTNLREELRRYVIHGILHLIGFADKTPGEKVLIRSLEEKYLK